MLQIQKRNGDLVSFDPKKILNRIKKASKGLKAVNSDEIFIKVITSTPTEGIVATKTLDTLISETAAAYTTSHYEYSKLAAAIAVSSYHKDSYKSFYATMKILNTQEVISDKLIEIIETYGIDRVESVLDFERDYTFDYFGWKAMQDVYLLKTSEGLSIERPQHLYMRVALWVTNTFEEAVDYYNELSNQMISKATPIMINSGTVNPQLASCVLKPNDGDNRISLLETFNDICIYSSDAAGIGLGMSNIRSKESKIKTSGGNAGGLLKYLKIVNEGLRFFNQQGRRPGSAAVYIEPWHKDVYDLLDIKKVQGKDELRARDIFTALWIPDNFMKAVKEDSDYYLFCPNDIMKGGLKAFHEIYGEEFEKEYDKAIQLGIGKKIKAKDLWLKILESQIETGVPYIGYKDHVNRKTNHQNIGVISQSNLCIYEKSNLNIIVNDEIKIVDFKELSTLLENGKQIKILSYNDKLNINEYQEISAIQKTSSSAEVLKIFDEATGLEIICTPNHEIYTKNRGWVKAIELTESDSLMIV